MNIISFTKVKLPYGWLGNMAPYPVTYEGKEYKTTEALFQALRFKSFPEIQELIRNKKSPMSAKMLAKSHVGLLNSVGYSQLSQQDVTNMEICLREKLNQHPQLKEMLLETEGSAIVEDCSSRPQGSGLFWGAEFKDGKWQGKNILGKLWMKLRAELILEKENREPHKLKNF